jgi:hypothetical protein
MDSIKIYAFRHPNSPAHRAYLTIRPTRLIETGSSLALIDGVSASSDVPASVSTSYCRLWYEMTNNNSGLGK